MSVTENSTCLGNCKVYCFASSRKVWTSWPHLGSQGEAVERHIPPGLLPFTTRRCRFILSEPGLTGQTEPARLCNHLCFALGCCWGLLTALVLAPFIGSGQDWSLPAAVECTVSLVLSMVKIVYLSDRKNYLSWHQNYWWYHHHRYYYFSC
jgi:hypothetical protein